MHFEQLHAMQYADNATKIYQFEKFRRRFPDLFGKHAVLETRPVDRDYYVPPSLSSRIVDKLAWDRLGCRYVSCFPFKSYEAPCRSNVDRMRWTRVDAFNRVMACQPACDRGLTLETKYRDGNCFVANQAKKLYVMYPERYNGMIAKHARLDYDLEEDRIAIGPTYCRAYGMVFDDASKDCYVPTAQYITEILLGSSIFRRHILQPLQIDSKPPPIEPIRSDVIRRFESVWREEKTKRTIDTARTDTVLNTDLDEHGRMRPESVAKIVAEVSAEIGVDLGIQVLTGYAKYLLSRKISARLASRILLEKSMKRAFVHGLAKVATSGLLASKTLTAAALTGLRTGVSAASGVFAVYGIMSLMVDIFDPYEYGKVLNREQVERIDRMLDLRYFETIDFRNVKLTPEDVWNVLQDEDDIEDEMSYYVKRYEEYMDSLKTVNHVPFTNKKIDLTRKVEQNTAPHAPLWILGLFLIASLILIKYVEYVAVLFCLILVWINKKILDVT